VSRSRPHIQKTSVGEALRRHPLFAVNIEEDHPESWPSWLGEIGYNSDGYPWIVITELPDTSPEARAFESIARIDGLNLDAIDAMDPETKRQYVRLIGSLPIEELTREFARLDELDP